MHTKILILQNKIPHYRIPFFDALARHPAYRVDVLHSGHSIRSTDDGLQFRERVTPTGRVGPLILQRGIGRPVLNADVIIAMFDLRWLKNAAMALSPRKMRPRLIFWGHGYGTSPLAVPLRTWLVKRADALLLYGEKPVEDFAYQGVPRNKIFVAPNTLQVPRPTYSTHRKKTNFLFVGRLQKRKKVDQLILAFSDAKERLPKEASLDIIGDGPELLRLRSLVTKRNLAHQISFHGKVTDPHKLSHYFGRAMAYVSPGATGLGVLHAFAHGVPVVTSFREHHGPEVQNITEEIDGLFYDGSTSALCGMLIRLAANPQEVERLGTNAYQKYWSTRTLDNMVDGFRRAIDFVQGEAPS